jgi:hypothetical protein
MRQQMMRYFASSPWPKFIEHPAFAQAWTALQKQSAPARKFVFSPYADLEGVAETLRTTKFADVEQGISEFRASRIPPAGSFPPTRISSGPPADAGRHA